MFKNLTNFVKNKVNNKLAQNQNNVKCPHELGKKIVDETSLGKRFADIANNYSKEELVKAMIEDIRENGKSSSAFQMAQAMGLSGPQSDTMPGAYGEFGKTKTNPIPVKGIHSIDNYLERLSRTDGENFSWNRIGSTGSENINGMIDIYDIINDNKTLIDKLYICAYSGKTTSKIPNGYKAS